MPCHSFLVRVGRPEAPGAKTYGYFNCLLNGIESLRLSLLISDVSLRFTREFYRTLVLQRSPSLLKTTCIQAIRHQVRLAGVTSRFKSPHPPKPGDVAQLAGLHTHAAVNSDVS